MLDVRRMRVLHAVAQQGSFSAAAAALSYTQSAVSQQIAALEREAGIRLVDRHPKGIRLTDAGRALVAHTEAILGRLADAEAELEAIAGLRGGRLRLGSFETAGAALLPPAIARFRAAHPGIELSLAEHEPEHAIPRLLSGELDLVLIFEPNQLSMTEGYGAVERVKLLDDPMYLAVPLGHPVADKERVRLADLAAENWINPTPECPCSQHVLRACGAAGFDPHVVFESDDYASILGFVAAGVGVALIPDLAFTTVRDDVVIREVAGGAPVREIYAALPAEGTRSPAAEAMLGVLQETAAAYRSNVRPPVAAVAA